VARSLNEIEKELLALPREERARLVLDLMRSLHDEGVDDDYDAFWRDELVRREQEIGSGKVEPIPSGKAIPKAREALAKRR
jgi:putative addiction module component (TIGR02574 family)